MANRIEKIMQKYTDRDFEALYSLYLYRCLSFDQLYDLHYKKSIKGTREVGPDYFRKKLTKFKTDGLIEENTHLDKTVPILYSILPDGVTALRKHFCFPNNIYNSERKRVERGYLTYSEVKVSYRFMPHQYNLNCFTLEAQELLDKYNVKGEYYDEKQIPPVLSIRPDAVTMTDKFDIYYEMDMGTETKHQLEEKWAHYRDFLFSSKNDPNKRKIILFICADRGKINNRIDVIKSTIASHFIDCIGKDVELYVGTPKKLMAIIKTKIIQEYFGLENALSQELRTALIKSGFQIAEASQLKSDFDNIKFLYYIKNQNEKDYMVDEFFGEPLGAMNRIAYYNKYNVGYKKTYKKDIPLILVATSEEAILNNCSIFNINPENVYFTTIRRLDKLPFHKAIFKLSYGNMFCFDSTFSNMVATSILKGE